MTHTQFIEGRIRHWRRLADDLTNQRAHDRKLTQRMRDDLEDEAQYVARRVRSLVLDLELERTRGEMEELKAEGLSGRGTALSNHAERGLGTIGGTSGQLKGPALQPASGEKESRLLPPPREVFACTIDESCGYGDECICFDPGVAEWTRCPVHGEPVD